MRSRAPEDFLAALLHPELCHVRKEHIPEFDFDTVLDVGFWAEGFDLFADALMVVCDPAMSVDQPVVQGMKIFPTLPSSEVLQIYDLEGFAQTNLDS